VGAPAPPRAVKQFFSGVIYREMCKCTPSHSNSQFLGQFLLGGLDLEVYLDGL